MQQNNTLTQDIISLKNADDEIHSNQFRDTLNRDKDALLVTEMHTDLMTKFDNISATCGVLFQIIREMCTEMRAIESSIDIEVSAMQSVLITRFDSLMETCGCMFEDTNRLRTRMNAIETRVQTLDTDLPLPQ